MADEHCLELVRATELARQIGKLLLTQDNRITADPVFCVQQRRRMYGIADGYTDGHVWCGDDGGESPEEVEGYTRVGYLDRWEFVTACFTQVAADAYIRRNGHRLTDPRVFVETAYRNEEWIGLRQLMVRLAKLEQQEGTPCDK